MKKVLIFLLCAASLFTLCACTGTQEPAAEDEAVTFANGVTKLATDLYTVTVTDEYDIHSMDEVFRGKYWNDNYADYYKAMMNTAGGACSGARSGDYVGRTYDWYYSDFPSVIVKTTATDERLASIACFSGAYNTEQIENEEVNLVYSLIVNDGINEAGVTFQQNVLQLGDEVTEGTNPAGEDTMALLVGRLVLDNAHSVDEAVELIRQANIYCTYSELLCEEYHWLISDKDKSVAVEMVDNQIVVTETDVITNFYVNSQYFDGTVESLMENQPTAMGWRRYFLLKDGIETVDSVEAMFNHMSKVFYWKAYDPDIEDYWYDEGYGAYDLDGDGEYECYFDMFNDSDDDPSCQAYREYYCTLGHMQQLDNGTWFTAHTTVFDLANREMTIVVDEQGYDTHRTFGFDF